MIGYEKKAILQRSWPWWRWMLIGLNTLALVLSGILSWHYLRGGSLFGCGGGSPCEQVLNSRWSTIAGALPVSGLAVGAYLATLVAFFFTGPATEVPIRRLAWSAMLVLVGLVAGSAVWFTIVQKWIIGDFCLYCTATHITGLIFAALVIWRAFTELDNHLNEIPLTDHARNLDVRPAAPRSIIHPLPGIGLTLIGLILAGILAAFQVGPTASVVAVVGVSTNNLPPIDYHTIPMDGSPDAPYIVNLLFDYECPHCQQIHLMLDEAIRRYGGKLAFALYPTPLNSHCNPYIPRDVNEFRNSCELAEIGLAVWLAKHEAFSSFDDWMFTYDSGNSWRPRSVEAARAKAMELVGTVKFDSAWSDPWIEKYMQTCIRTYGETIQNGNGGVPKIILGSHWVIPEPYNADDLVVILQKSLGVPKP